MMLRQEQQAGEASELTVLGRASARRAGLSAPRGKRLPDAGEQAAVQGGHLVLSALAGGAYAAAFDAGVPVLPSGVGFGLAFYVLAHMVAGSALGIKAPEWRQPSGTPVQHAAIHAAFGVITVLGARLGTRASWSRW